MQRKTGRGLWSLVLVAAIAPCAAGNDWPSWRGPEQRGFSRELTMVFRWVDMPGARNLLWKVPVGGRSTPIIMDGRLFAITPVGEGECRGEQLICLDAESGKTLWKRRFNVFHTDIVENRVGWTSPVGDPETGRVYVHATGGELTCYDRDGELQWKWSLSEELGRTSGYGGRLHTPIIDEDRLIISCVYILSDWGTGKKKAGHRYYAFDKRTGDILWTAQPGGRPLDTTYSVPIVGVFGGRRMLIAGNADGNVYGMEARTGRKLWTYRLSKRGLNASPVSNGRYVYFSHSEENVTGTVMGGLVCIDPTLTGDITETGEVWRNNDVSAGYSSLAMGKGRIYACSNSGTLYSIDAMDGSEYWNFDLGTVMKGSPTVTWQNTIYVGEVNGNFWILRDHHRKCDVIDHKQFKRDDGSIVEIFGSPAVANGRVYFMTRYDTYCLGDASRVPDSVVIPPFPPEESPSAGDAAEKPATLQLWPTDKTIAPGENVLLHARLLDGHGRFLSDLSPSSMPARFSWTTSGLNGRIGADGLFSADHAPAFSAGTVTLTAYGLAGSARLRVSPRLPIAEGFEGMKVGTLPPGWIGIDGKTVLTQKDGGMVLMKKAERPSAMYARMRAYSGPPLAVGYTVQADLMGTPSSGRRAKISDMGLINTRYKLIMLAKEQRLRLVSWSPMPRVQEETPFDWKGDTWYRAKLRVELRDRTAVVRGRVWPRDAVEPSDWQIELIDPCPNVEGSPGLYAYSKGTTPRRHGAPVYFDNYRVFRND